MFASLTLLAYQASRALQRPRRMYRLMNRFLRQLDDVLLLAPSHDVAVDFGALIARSQFPSRCERFLVLEDNVPQSEKPLSSLHADYPGLSPKPLAFALSVAVLTRRVLVAPANASRAAAASERLPGDAGGVATTGVCGGAPRGVRLGEPTSSRLPLVDGESTDSTSADAGRDP